MGTKNHPSEFDCYEAADPDEPMFILLGRDELGPERVEEWARRRFEKVAEQLASIQYPDRYNDKNKAWLTKQLRKIAEALKCANDMREWKINKAAKDKLGTTPIEFPWAHYIEPLPIGSASEFDRTLAQRESMTKEMRRVHFCRGV